VYSHSTDSDYQMLAKLILIAFHRGVSRPKFPMWQSCFCQWSASVPVDSGHWTHRGRLYCGSTAYRNLSESTCSSLAYVKQSEFIEKPSPIQREPLRKGSSRCCSNEPQTITNYWTNITWHKSVMSDRVHATLEISRRMIAPRIKTVRGNCSGFQTKSQWRQ